MKNSVLLLFCAIVSHSLFAQSGNFKLDKDYPISKTGTLDLRSSDADVFITGSDRSTAHVKIERTVESKGVAWGDEKFTVDVNEENGNLLIRERQENIRVGVIGYYRENYKIDIQIPLGVSLKIQGDDGDYFIKNVNGAIAMDIDDGDAELSACGGSLFSFNVDDGDISMDGGQGVLEIDGDDSDIKIRNATFSFVRAEIDDGDIRIETSLVANADYTIDSQDGSIVLDILGGGGIFDIRHDDARVITEGNFKSVQRDDEHTKVSLAGGSAKINIRSDDGSVRLSAN